MTIDTFMSVDVSNILSMASVRCNRVYLPYRVDGNILFHVSNLLAGMVDSNGTYDDSNDDDMMRFRAEVDKAMAGSAVRAFLVPHVSRRFPSVGFVIEVDAPNGEHLTERVHMPRSEKQAGEILSAFFAAGAKGLNAGIRESFKRQLTTT